MTSKSKVIEEAGKAYVTAVNEADEAYEDAVAAAAAAILRAPDAREDAVVMATRAYHAAIDRPASETKVIEEAGKAYVTAVNEADEAYEDAVEEAAAAILRARDARDLAAVMAQRAYREAVGEPPKPAAAVAE